MPPASARGGPETGADPQKIIILPAEAHVADPAFFSMDLPAFQRGMMICRFPQYDMDAGRKIRFTIHFGEVKSGWADAAAGIGR